MKVSIIFLFVTFLFYSCTDSAKKLNVEGIYVTQFKNEFSVTDDSLVVKKINSSNYTYSIQRKSGFNKIRNGVRQPKEFKTQFWDATFNPDKKVLLQSELGKQIYLLNNSNLKLGNSEYQKVK